MLWQVKKVMHGHFSDLSSLIRNFNDPRIGIEYTIEELLMAAIVLFVLKCDSRNSFNHKVKDENFCKNYYRIFRLSVPHMDAVNDLLAAIKTEVLEDLRCHVLQRLIEKRVFHQYRFFDKYFCIAIDATGVYNWTDDALPEDIGKHALQKTSKKGKITRFTLVVEAVLICSNGMTIPLMSEWVANDGKEYVKQDCELNAFKRLAKRLKSCFPRLSICLLVDGLYTNVSLMDICKEYQWKFITVFKDGNLSTVWEEVKSLLPLNQDKSIKEQISGDANHWYTRNYKWLCDIEYQKHKIQYMECTETTQHRKSKEECSHWFVFLTNLDVDANNVASFIRAGRARWGIEDAFNTQKNRGYVLHHKFNRVNFNAIKNWHNIRQLAFLVCKFVEYTQETGEVKKEISTMTIKELWQDLNWFLTMCDVDDVCLEFDQLIKPRIQIRLQ